MDQILSNNMPEINDSDTGVPFSFLDADSLNTATVPQSAQGDILDWLYNKTIGAEDSQVEDHYSPMDLDVEEDDFLPSFLSELEVPKKETDFPTVVKFEEPTPTPSTSSQFNQPGPVEFRIGSPKERDRFLSCC